MCKRSNIGCGEHETIDMGHGCLLGGKGGRRGRLHVRDEGALAESTLSPIQAHLGKGRLGPGSETDAAARKRFQSHGTWDVIGISGGGLFPCLARLLIVIGKKKRQS